MDFSGKSWARSLGNQEDLLMGSPETVSDYIESWSNREPTVGSTSVGAVDVNPLDVAWLLLTWEVGFRNVLHGATNAVFTDGHKSGVRDARF